MKKGWFIFKECLTKSDIISITCLFVSWYSSTKNIGNAQRDGSSFKKAIIAKSISAEYEYVRKVCSDCQLLGQFLVFEKKKPYDILKLKKSNGESISYYFDISKFYGKGF